MYLRLQNIKYIDRELFDEAVEELDRQDRGYNKYKTIDDFNWHRSEKGQSYWQKWYNHYIRSPDSPIDTDDRKIDFSKTYEFEGEEFKPTTYYDTDKGHLVICICLSTGSTYLFPTHLFKPKHDATYSGKMERCQPKFATV